MRYKINTFCTLTVQTHPKSCVRRIGMGQGLMMSQRSSYHGSFVLTPEKVYICDITNDEKPNLVQVLQIGSYVLVSKNYFQLYVWNRTHNKNNSNFLYGKVFCANLDRQKLDPTMGSFVEIDLTLCLIKHKEDKLTVYFEFRSNANWIVCCTHR